MSFFDEMAKIGQALPPFGSSTEEERRRREIDRQRLLGSDRQAEDSVREGINRMFART